jgi:hypothetical protein
VGYWKSVDDLQQQWSIDRIYSEMPKEEVDKLLKTGIKPLDALETGLKNNFISKQKNMTPFIAEIIGQCPYFIGNG